MVFDFEAVSFGGVRPYAAGRTVDVRPERAGPTTINSLVSLAILVHFRPTTSALILLLTVTSGECQRSR